MPGNDSQEREAGSIPFAGRRIPIWISEGLVPWLILSGLTLLSLIITWRRWPDLLVDFGRELYVPWRLSQGAVLYRDVDDFYGPLSQYANAALFSVFGPGLMVLVWANLAVFGGIVLLLYRLVRRAWGWGAAVGSSGIFVLMFGFTRFSTTGSFNYATPYSHEATHGLLVLLLLTGVLSRWTDRSGAGRVMAAGLLFGLTLVLKPEIAFAGAIITGAAAVHLLPCRQWRWRWCAVWLVGAWVPTLFFTGLFLQYFPWPDAIFAACRGWLNVVATNDYVRDPVQLTYLGLDAPAKNALAQLRATGIAVLGFGWIGLGGFAVGRLDRTWSRALVVVVMSAGLLVVGFWNTSQEWTYVGRSLPFLGVILAGWEVGRFFRGTGARSEAMMLRILLSLLGLAMMARMGLNGRIYQFGFYQSAIAAVVVVAFLLGEFPGLVGRTPWARGTVLIGALALIGPGVAQMSVQNQQTNSLINFSIGEGRDRFLTFRPDFLASTPTLAGLTAQLSKLPPGQTLLVLPEGLMLNYLTRMPSPLPQFFYYSVATEAGRERELVIRLREKPPNWVILVARDLKEYGIARYGERPGAGQELLAWVAQNYDPAGMIDGLPMALERHGAQLFHRKSPAAR